MFVRKYIVAISFAINSYMLGSCWSSFSKICCCCGSGSRSSPGNDETTNQIKDIITTFGVCVKKENADDRGQVLGIIVYVDVGVNLNPNQENSIYRTIWNGRDQRYKGVESLAFCELDSFIRWPDQSINEDKIFCYRGGGGNRIGVQGLAGAKNKEVYTKSRYLLVPTSDGKGHPDMVLLHLEDDGGIRFVGEGGAASDFVGGCDFVRRCANYGARAGSDYLNEFLTVLYNDVRGHASQGCKIEIRDV